MLTLCRSKRLLPVSIPLAYVSSVSSALIQANYAIAHTKNQWYGWYLFRIASNHIEKCLLLSSMAPPKLVNWQRPPAVFIPLANSRQPLVRPQLRTLRMLKYAAKSSNHSDSKTRQVLFIVTRLRKVPKPSPCSARRVCDRRASALPVPCITFGVPNINSRQQLVIAI